jgi:hypothetical protein
MKARQKKLTLLASRIGLATSFMFILLVGTSCSTTMLTDYKPKSDLNSLDAATIIIRAFEEQPGDYRPIEISVGDDAIRLTLTRYQIDDDFRRVPVGKTLVTIYYRTLGKHEVFSKRGKVNVILRDKYGETLRRVFFPGETEAKQFLDALETLRLRDNPFAPKKQEPIQQKVKFT